jgi:anti-sigma factor RsiW
MSEVEVSVNEMHVSPETIMDYLHRELALEEDASVHTHLSACAACKAEYDAQASLTEVVRAHARLEERDLPPRVVAAVRDRLEHMRATPAWFMQLAAALRPIIAVPVAAALVLAAAIGFTSVRLNAHGPTVTAAYYLDDHAALASRVLPFAQSSTVPETLQNSGTQSTSVAAGPSLVAGE